MDRTQSMGVIAKGEDLDVSWREAREWEPPRYHVELRAHGTEAP